MNLILVPSLIQNIHNTVNKRSTHRMSPCIDEDYLSAVAEKQEEHNDIDLDLCTDYRRSSLGAPIPQFLVSSEPVSSHVRKRRIPGYWERSSSISKIKK